MKDGLLLVERIIIESLAKKEKNVFELEIDTNLDQALLLNILPNLLMKNLVRYQRGIYSIDKEKSLLWLDTINERENIKEEVKELFTSLVNEYFKDDLKKSSELKVQKIWLTRDEELILKGHLNTLESFFSSVRESRKSRPQKEKTAEQKVVVWGLSNYQDIVQGVLEAV